MDKTTIIFIGTPEAFKAFRGSFAGNISTVQFTLVCEAYLLEYAYILKPDNSLLLPVMFHESAADLPADELDNIILFFKRFYER